MWQSDGMTSAGLSGFSEQVLVAYGAKVNLLINEQRQWWRLLLRFRSCQSAHLLVNMYSLWVVGPYVEKLYGSAKFVCSGSHRSRRGCCQLSLGAWSRHAVGKYGSLSFKTTTFLRREHRAHSLDWSASFVSALNSVMNCRKGSSEHLGLACCRSSLSISSSDTWPRSDR